MVLALLAVLILGGGGAATYFYFKQPAEAAIGESEEHQDAKEAHGGKDAKHHEFVELDPLVLPIVDKNGVSQVVNIVVVIEVDDSKDKDHVLKLQPRLKDAYIQELYGVLNRHDTLKDGVVQVGTIKERLNQISHRVMGEGVVEDVLLQVVQQRPM
jgi:flagellar FliL protein